MLLKFLFLIFFIMVNSSFSQETYFCKPELELMPTQAGGRVKPLGVLASESLKFITGKDKFDQLTPVQTFCLKSFTVYGLKGPDLYLKVEHPEVQKLLPSFPYLLQPDNSALQAELEKKYFELKENNAVKKELSKVIERLSQYQNLIQGVSWTIPTKPNADIQWMPLNEYMTPDKFNGEINNETVYELLWSNKKNYDTLGDHKYIKEYYYFKYNPFVYSIFLVLITLTLLTVLKNKFWGMLFFTLTIITETYGIILRVLISGRAPITNMYETVMFSGFGAIIIGLIIYLYKKELKFIYASLAHNLLCLLMMKFANNMLSPSISPLVPVLRDNFWLSTHVTTIILSYAALALSWILSNISLIQMMRGKLTKNELIYNSTIIYTAIKYGVTLLALGIILGGIWADYSWGRFWGWDPKETWSLIVFLIYIAILHGKSTSWIKPYTFVPLVAGAFMSVMMAWFGVNYILATGLHSYGFSEGGAIFLLSFFIIQIIIIVLALPKTKVFLLSCFLIGCSHQAKKNPELSTEPMVSLTSSTELARSSYLKGCVDSKFITKYSKTIYNECLKLAIIYEKEIYSILK